MFICATCVQKYEGPAIDNAKGTIFRSKGRCELCEKPGKICYDIPSSAAWWPKKKRKK